MRGVLLATQGEGIEDTDYVAIFLDKATQARINRYRLLPPEDRKAWLEAETDRIRVEWGLLECES